ncbi:zinc finger protein 253 [Anabrus simplex]|uniref:zinc finger protein 253 n=1 Tax=Anabrus simplex TaxID=316456 RepID=UPI0035A2F4EE
MTDITTVDAADVDADGEMETDGTNLIMLHVKDDPVSTFALNMGVDPAENDESEGDDPFVSSLAYEDKFSCEHCDELFTRKAQIKEHLFKVHIGKFDPHKKNKGVYSCPHCDKSYRHLSKLNNHLGCHTHEKKYSCNLCWKGFSRFRDMSKHRSTHVGTPSIERVQKQNSQYRCSECNTYFQLPSVLKEHLRTHVRKKELDTSSDDMSTSTSNKSRGPEETREMEGDYPLVSYIGYENRFFCRHCDDVLTGEDKLKDHLIEVHKEKVSSRKQIRGVYPCPHCDQSFWYPSRLYEHLWSHTTKRRYICDICLKGFSRNYDMHTHRRKHFVSPALKRVQEREGEYQCFECNKVFQWQSELKAHLESCNKKEEIVDMQVL